MSEQNEMAEAVAALQALDGSSDPMDLDRALAAKSALWKRTSEIMKEIGEAGVAFIDANGETTIGDKRYYVGTTKDYKVRSLVDAVPVLFDAAQGDFQGLADCLSSSALKHGAIRGLLEKAGMAERFTELFEVSEKMDVKTGKPARVLKGAEND